MGHPSGAVRFICRMDKASLLGQIGVETDWIPFRINAVKEDRSNALDFFGPGTESQVVNMDLSNMYSQITKIADMGMTPLPGLQTGQFFQGGGWAGYVKTIPKQSSGGVPGTPNAITFAVGARNAQFNLMGDSENWCLITLPGAPPVTTQKVE